MSKYSETGVVYIAHAGTYVGDVLYDALNHDRSDDGRVFVVFNDIFLEVNKEDDINSLHERYDAKRTK